MTRIEVIKVGKAYKYYTSKWLRLVEKLGPRSVEYHTKKWVLKNISFTVQTGESVGIVGLNGAGKSTLLKLLTGTTKPTTGHIIIQGSVASLLELGVGFHPDFSGRQNVYMSWVMMGYSQEVITNLIPDIEKFADIGDYIDQPVRIYSSGMQMRLAFAVATAARPDILIVDEALSVGDSSFQAKCFTRISGFKKKGTTLLLVSHSAGDIVTHCDRAIFLKDGAIALDGVARDVTNRYLDELFSKQSDTAQNNAPVKTLVKLSLSHCNDLFASRYGYRAEEYRWGKGGAKIIDFNIQSGGEHYPAAIDSNSEINFCINVLFEQDFDSVVPGMLIKNLEGLFLYGTNSFLCSQDQKNIAVKAGEIRVFAFSFFMNLNRGDYLLSCGISAGNPLGEIVPLDRRYDAIMLHVNRKVKFWGLVDLASTFKSHS